MIKVTRTVLAALALGALGSGLARAQDTGPLIEPGINAVTGFSGALTAESYDALSRPVDETFLDGNGASLKVMDLRQAGHVWDGRLENDVPLRLAVSARQIGQVFGLAMDRGDPADGANGAPNVYATATSAFGLHLVTPDNDNDGLPERVITGSPEAGWMAAQWGDHPGAGPGSIWKIDGRTREVSLFANVTLDGRPNSGAGLGNIAHDPATGQLFVSDRETGMIHRFDRTGRDIGHYDHGVTGRQAAGLAPVPFDPASGIDLASSDFDTLNPGTWNLAVPERRVWGLGLQNGRLFYAVAAGGPEGGAQVWSVGINEANGDFAGDPRVEIDVPVDGPALEISDIAFSIDGPMLLAERGTALPEHDYSAFAKPDEARVLRYWRENPDDPATPGTWTPEPEEYAVGFKPEHRNSDGGISLGYGYDEHGRANPAVCGQSVWFTGSALRINRDYRAALEAGGDLVVHGLQVSPFYPVRDANLPPWASYFADFDGRHDDPQSSGKTGDVEVYAPGCEGQEIPSGTVADAYSLGPWWTVTERPGGYPVCHGPGCAPAPCWVTGTCAPPPSACMAIKTDLTCDTTTGLWTLTAGVTGVGGFAPDSLKVTTASPGVSIANGPVLPLSPAQIVLAGASPWQPVTLSLCAFKIGDLADNKPATCCRVTAAFAMPGEVCVKK